MVGGGALASLRPVLLGVIQQPHDDRAAGRFRGWRACASVMPARGCPAGPVMDHVPGSGYWIAVIRFGSLRRCRCEFARCRSWLSAGRAQDLEYNASGQGEDGGPGRLVARRCVLAGRPRADPNGDPRDRRRAGHGGVRYGRASGGVALGLRARARGLDGPMRDGHGRSGRGGSAAAEPGRGGCADLQLPAATGIPLAKLDRSGPAAGGLGGSSGLRLRAADPG